MVKQYGKLFEMEEVDLSFTDDALTAIAKRAIERKTGARGLRSIIEAILLDTMFDLPSMEGVAEVVVDKDVVEGRKEPVRVFADKGAQAEDAALESVWKSGAGPLPHPTTQIFYAVLGGWVGERAGAASEIRLEKRISKRALRRRSA